MRRTFTWLPWVLLILVIIGFLGWQQLQKPKAPVAPDGVKMPAEKVEPLNSFLLSFLILKNSESPSLEAVLFLFT